MHMIFQHLLASVAVLTLTAKLYESTSVKKITDIIF